MKKVIILFIVSLLSLKIYSQAIRFEQLSLQQAFVKARLENKLIFIDVYTSWCGYCKQMDQNVFSSKEVGDFYNNHFINLKYDAQKGDGITIRRSYTLLGFPTFLYLDFNGRVVKKTAGYQEKDAFLQNADAAIVTL